MECGVNGIDGQVAVGVVEEEDKREPGAVRILLHLGEENNALDVR